MGINRRKTKEIYCGDLKIGGGNPILVQSMTSTVTSDYRATIAQIKRLDKAGCEIIRVSIPDKKSLGMFDRIVCSTKRPIVADIHFSAGLAIGAIEKGAKGIRINPGNIGSFEEVRRILSLAKDKNCCVRIGVNSGSLDKKYLVNGRATPAGLVDSALEFVGLFESAGFFNTKISIKSSNVAETVECNRLLSKACDYPIHLGVTESGTMLNGSVRSAVALGILLGEGIGDTIRVSLSSDPVREVEVAWEILKSLGLRSRGVTVIACPTCSRKSFDVEKMARRVEKRLSSIEIPMTVAVMGCVVNGPGEASQADIGIAGGKGKSVLFEEGRVVAKLTAGQLERELVKRALSRAGLKKGKG